MANDDAITGEASLQRRAPGMSAMAAEVVADQMINAGSADA